MKQFMFDTCTFNHILERDIDLEIVKSKGRCFVTHIQRDEITRCPDEIKRNKLLEVFVEVQEASIPTESFVLDVSILGGAKLSGGPGTSCYEAIKSDLDRIKKKPNNIQDALIGETALKNKFVFVTDDEDLLRIMKKYGCDVVTLKEFLTF